MVGDPTSADDSSPLDLPAPRHEEDSADLSTVVNVDDQDAEATAILKDEDETLEGFKSPSKKQPWEPGTKIDDYELVEKLGVGGMGVVWRVTDPAGQPYALKTLRPQAIAKGLVSRFRREIRAQIQIDLHPHVVKVEHTGQYHDQEYFVMELCSGGSLKQRIKNSGALHPRLAAGITAAVARGMAHVHGKGILHRDLKTSNVLFDGQGNPKLVDFGLALIEGEDGAESWRAGTGGPKMLGTPIYMAPEQLACERDEIDERTDVYGLGVIFYKCLTNELPYEGSSMLTLVTAMLKNDPRPPRAVNPELPEELERICLRAIAKERAERYATAGELAEDLEAWCAVHDARLRTRGVMIVLGLLMLGCALGFLWKTFG